MQRTTPDNFIVISCDYCGSDWDEVKPMIEGHRGSVICLDCLKQALVQMGPGRTLFKCTLCRHDFPAARHRWRPDPLPPGANPDACLCDDCMAQAAKAFDKDPEVDWTWDRAGRQQQQQQQQ